MPSLSETSTSGKALLWFAPLLLPLLLSSCSVGGASLREHRLRGTELDRTPDEDMLKALRHIESLHQRTGAKSQLQTPLFPTEYGDDGQTDDARKLRAMMALASPKRSQAQLGEEEEQRQPEGEEMEVGEREREANEEDKTQELLQAVLRTVQQTEQASRHERGGLRPEERATVPRVTNPLMFDEEEEADVEGDGDEGDDMDEEDDEDEDDLVPDRASPFVKRTSEDVGEKYTPQNLATLQSVFEELGKLVEAKDAHKRRAQEGEDEDEEEGGDDEEDDEDLFNERNLAYEDEAGGLADWPQHEGREEEEGDDGGEEDDDRYNDEEEEDYPMKRSTNPGPPDDGDDMANLVDYYLLKVLEKTEEEQKRELKEAEEEEDEEEEKQRAERRLSQSQFRDNRDPSAIYQLIQISQKYQIPPEDLIDMLKTGEVTNRDRTAFKGRTQTHKSSGLARAGDRFPQTSSNKKHKNPESKFYNGRRPDRPMTYMPEDTTTEEILNVLGLGSLGSQGSPPLEWQKPRKNRKSQLHVQPGRQAGYKSQQTRVPNKLKDNYDDTVGEDELAAYLAARLLARYPDSRYNKAGQKRAPPEGGRAEAEPAALGSFDQAIQDYFDQMDSERRPPQKRQSEAKDAGGAIQTQSLDDDALMKIMSFLDPEDETSEENVGHATEGK